MSRVFDPAAVAQPGELAQSAQHVIECHGKTLDEAVPGIGTLHGGARHNPNQAREMSSADLWRPIEDWKVD